jgi:hypothetical protein
MLAAILWWCVHSPVRVGDAGRSESQGGRDSPPGAPATAGSELEDRVRGVAATVAARNRNIDREEQQFRRAGWTMVASEPPDPRLVALDPTLLPTREAELRVQIASTVASPAEAPRLHQIVLQAHDAATRLAAVDALGRVGAPEAQAELEKLLGELAPDDDARKQIVPLLRPRALDDESGTRLLALLDSPSLTPVEKKQLAFTLALVGLRDGVTVPEGAVSTASRELIDRMTALAQRGTETE